MSTLASRNKPPAPPADLLAAIRANLRAAREARDLSPEQVAAAAKLSRSAVRNIESGATTPALGTLAAIAAALGTDLPRLTRAEKIPKKS